MLRNATLKRFSFLQNRWGKEKEEKKKIDFGTRLQEIETGTRL